MKLFNSGILCCFLVLLSVLTGCTTNTNNDMPEEADLTLIYTTDLHGQLLDYDYVHQQKDSTSLSNLATLVKQRRVADPDGVILLDNGDLIEGSPSMYYYNYAAIREPHLAIRVMNWLKYDAVEMGNHDFEPGEAIYLDHMLRDMKSPLLCANAIDSRTEEPMFKPYTVVTRKGFRIAVLGLVSADTHLWVSPSAIPHLRFDAMLQTARKWVDYIEQEEKPDLIVLLSHAGSERVLRHDDMGLGYYDGTIEVARQVQGIDIVLMGHDHQLVQDTLIDDYGKEIPVLQPNSHAEEFGLIDLHLRHVNKAHAEIVSCNMQRIDAKSLPEDEEYNQAFKDDIAKINKYLDKPIGALDFSIEGNESLVGPSPIMTLIHQVQLTLTGADISMASALSTFSEVLQGDITMRTLFSLYKYENQLVRLRMTGEEVKKFLEYGYGRQFAEMKHPDDHLLAFKYDNKGKIIMGKWGPELVMPQYFYTSCGGLNYEVDVTRPIGNRVRILGFADGRKFDLHQSYVVCMTSFQAQGGGGFTTQGLGWDEAEIKYRTITQTNKDVRLFIAEFLGNRQNGASMYPVGNWRVVPELWWQRSKDRDVELLLPYIRK